MKKLVLFGDSLLANFDKDLVSKLEEQLKDYDIYNCAVSGWDTNDGMKKSLYISCLKPDVVVIGFGTNDAAPWKQVSLEQFTKNVNTILDNFNSSKIVFFLPPPVNEEEEEKREKRTNKVMKQYHDAARQISLGKGAEVLDSWSIFMSFLKQGREYHLEDGIHLNDFGYEVFTESLVKIIQHGREK